MDHTWGNKDVNPSSADFLNEFQTLVDGYLELSDSASNLADEVHLSFLIFYMSRYTFMDATQPFGTHSATLFFLHVYL